MTEDPQEVFERVERERDARAGDEYEDWWERHRDTKHEADEDEPRLPLTLRRIT